MTQLIKIRFISPSEQGTTMHVYKYEPKYISSLISHIYTLTEIGWGTLHVPSKASSIESYITWMLEVFEGTW